jgi:D-tagatose-1,6-bisphosphate aldolase subunit GatZ/KbaZ
MNAGETLQSLAAENRAGRLRGIPSWCTAHPQTLLAILRSYADDSEPILIEATCNQVNHRGGYTGMTPRDFRSFVEGLARQARVDPARVIFGGDHLGPNPWKRLPAAKAMEEAKAMVRAFVEAGFQKIHLDASMACDGDGTLVEATIAARASELCAVAEAYKGISEPVYVVGTEVPIPGGELQALDALAVTPPEAARRTYELHRLAFAAHGVEGAMARVLALVVQPGVDMGNVQVFEFDRQKAAALSEAVRSIPDVVFEAHSTDFQSERSLRDLVAGHFAILKVGPSLTFAFREAVVAMASIEEQLAPNAPANIVPTLLEAMDADPKHWRDYIERGAQERLLMVYGLSDRIRYYWPTVTVQVALSRLFANIDAAQIPPGLLHQFAGDVPPGAGNARLSEQIVQAKVGAVVASYRRAAEGG